MKEPTYAITVSLNDAERTTKSIVTNDAMEARAFINRLAEDFVKRLLGKELNSTFCDKCNAVYGDGHDCDNCPFCGTDVPEPRVA